MHLAIGSLATVRCAPEFNFAIHSDAPNETRNRFALRKSRSYQKPYRDKFTSPVFPENITVSFSSMVR